VKQAKSLRQKAIALSVTFENVPRVQSKDRIRYDKLNDDFWHVTVHFGFVEIPDLRLALSRAAKQGLPVLDDASYYIERDDPVSSAHRGLLSRLRIALFAFMSRNSAHAIDRFKIPTDALIEIGRRIEI
jgi:KUP system potassium uptake protein